MLWTWYRPAHGRHHYTENCWTSRTVELHRFYCQHDIWHNCFKHWACDRGMCSSSAKSWKSVIMVCLPTPCGWSSTNECIRGYEDRSVKIARSITVCPVQETLSNDSPNPDSSARHDWFQCGRWTACRRAQGGYSATSFSRPRFP